MRVQHERIRSAVTANDGDHIRICDHEFTFQISTLRTHGGMRGHKPITDVHGYDCYLAAFVATSRAAAGAGRGSKYHNTFSVANSGAYQRMAQPPRRRHPAKDVADFRAVEPAKAPCVVLPGKICWARRSQPT